MLCLVHIVKLPLSLQTLKKEKKKRKKQLRDVTEIPGFLASLNKKSHHFCMTIVIWTCGAAAPFLVGMSFPCYHIPTSLPLSFA